MKNHILRFVFFAISLPAFLPLNTCFAQGFLPPGSIKNWKPGSACDERPYSGFVVDAILKASGGKDADGLEVEFRKGNQMAHKVKRVRVNAKDRMAYPVVLSDGDCARIWDSQPFSSSQLNQLLTTEESLKQLSESDLTNAKPGKHFTERVYLILRR
jgi:hypothetical protein